MTNAFCVGDVYETASSKVEILEVRPGRRVLYRMKVDDHDWGSTYDTTDDQIQQWVARTGAAYAGQTVKQTCTKRRLGK